MAFSRIQATGKVTATGVASIAITLGSAPAAGNGLVVGVLASTTTAFPGGACSDNQGNTYALAFQYDYPFGGRKIAMYYCAAIATSGSPFTITVNPALGSLTFYGVAVEVGGVGGGLAVDVTSPGAQGNGTAPNAGASTARTANNVFSVAGFVTGVAQTSITVSSGWTEELEQLTGSLLGEIDTQVETAASGTTIVVNWTMTAADWWAGRSLSFKALPAPVVGETSQTFLTLPV